MQVVQISTTDIAQLHPFEVIPNALVRVKIRSRAGKLFQMQAFSRSSLEKVLDLLTTMNRRAIPDEQDRPLDLAQEHAQEADYTGSTVEEERTCMNSRPSRVMPLIAERWSRVKGTRRPGVCPRGAHVRTAIGNRENPASSTQTMVRPSSSAFFLGPHFSLG
jgi:hypothetical protein